jgi:ATP-dependent Clp protease ATP-binding subunit ClpB
MRTVNISLRGEQVRGLLRKFEHLIVGQDEAIEKITNLLERYLGGLSDPKRPIGSAIFLGPTGVGKTAVVEAMCEGLYGKADHMIKIDCAEYQHSHEVAKLIGSPPGYLGHKDTPARLKQETITGLYTPDVPFAVVLFDEIEKAAD